MRQDSSYFTEEEIEFGKEFWCTAYCVGENNKETLEAGFEELSRRLGTARATHLVKQLKSSDSNWQKGSEYWDNWQLFCQKTFNSNAVMEELQKNPGTIKSKQRFINDIYRILDQVKIPPVVITGFVQSQLTFYENLKSLLISSLKQKLKRRTIVRRESEVSSNIFKELTRHEMQQFMELKESERDGYTKVYQLISYLIENFSRLSETGRYMPDNEYPYNFNRVEAKEENWFQKVFIDTLPDHFIVYCMDEAGNTLLSQKGNKITITEADLNNVFPKENESLSRNDSILKPSWMTDYNIAVRSGMAVTLKVPEPMLKQLGSIPKIVVLGLSDEYSKGNILQGLIDGHGATADNMGFISPGTPTNNTKSATTGISDSENSVKHIFQGVIEPVLFNRRVPAPAENTDQEIFERALGLKAGSCNNFLNNSNTTISNALNMNRALYNTTIGSMLFDFWGTLENRAVSEAVKDFYSNYVLARGAVPSIRIDRQPYGILPTTSWSSFDPLTCCSNSKEKTITEKRIVEKSFKAVNTIYKDLQSIAADKVFSKKDIDKSGKTDEAYLNMLGNNPVSQQFNYRSSINSGNRIDTEPFKWALKELVNFQEDESLNANQLAAKFFSIFELKSLVHTLRNKRNYKTVSLRNRLEYLISKSRALNLRYLNEVETYNGNIVSHDEAKNALEMSAENNYIKWLFENFDKPKRVMNIPEFGSFKDKKIDYKLPQLSGNSNAPIAGNLMFFMLRQSLLLMYKKEALTVLMELGYIFDKRVNYYDSKLIYSDYSGSWGVLFDTIEDFVRTTKVNVDSKLRKEKLYNILTDKNKFNEIEAVKNAKKRINEYKTYLDSISSCTIPELRNLFAEQLDLSSYRIDAWMLGFVNKKMHNMMESKSYRVQVANYGYLENVKPAPRKKLKMVPKEFQSLFERDSERRIRSNTTKIFSSKSDEIIHAPSLDHAATAGVLKSAYNRHKFSSTDLNNPFSINLNSERIRKALALMENVRSGQDISTYLGYRIERYLHDSSVEMDWCIYELRKFFPTADSVNKADKISDAEKELQVVNGLDLVNTYRSSPFEIGSLPDWAKKIMTGKTDEFKNVLVNGIKELVDIVDAVSDLTITESVYHIVKGDHVQASTVISAIGEGRPLPEFEFTKTPVDGTPVHHKTVLHLPVDQSKLNRWSDQDSFLYLLNPQLNSWITTLLPDPSTIYVKYMVDETLETTTLNQLGIEAIDLVMKSGSNSDLITFVQKLIENHEGVQDGSKKVEVITKPEKEDNSISVFALEFLFNSIHKAVKDSKPVSDETFEIADDGGRGDIIVDVNDLDTRIDNFINLYLNNAEDSKKIKELKKEYDKAEDKSKLEKAEDIVNSVFNGEVAIVPVYKLDGQPGDSIYTFSSFNNIPSGSDGSLKLDSWLSSISKVRKNMKVLSNISTMASCLDIPFPQVSPVQYPELENWLGTDYSTPLSEDEEGNAYTSFNIINRDFAENSSGMCGIVLDEWVEVLPVKEHTTAIAINTDQPDAVAPQSLLLAVPPHNKGDNWDHKELLDVVTGTIDMSKVRLLEPQHLNQSIYSQVLPGMNVEMEADNKSNLRKGKVSFSDISSSKIEVDYDQILSDVIGAGSDK